MRFWPQALGAIFFLSGMTGAATAGEFSVACSYKNNNLQRCADHVADLVTDKFTDKYPIAKYQIFVHSNAFTFTNGGYSTYAVAGVIPRGSWQFPVQTFSSTNINGTNTPFDAQQIAEQERQIYRSAVKSLMDACAVSPGCDIYSPRSGK